MKLNTNLIQKFCLYFGLSHFESFFLSFSQHGYGDVFGGRVATPSQRRRDVVVLVVARRQSRRSLVVLSVVGRVGRVVTVAAAAVALTLR